MIPKDISITDFNYLLPDERIAIHPLPERDDSKLLVYHNHHIITDTYKNITDHLPQNSLLVFNDTRVVEARIIFKKETGGSIEIFCLEPHEQYGDITRAMMQQKKVWWKCLVGGASKWKKGQVLKKIIEGAHGDLHLTASFIEKKSDHFIIELSWKPEQLSFAEMLHLAGLIPLPPYIKRNAEPEDLERYQTIYAAQDGSVAAPTAGLHFTGNIFKKLALKKIDRAFITLHVGAGTFKPVKASTLGDHEMHEEFIEVNSAAIEKILNHKDGMIIPVGTTSLRTIESIYWLGVKTILDPHLQPEQLLLHQWEVYEINADGISALQSLQSLLNWMQRHHLSALVARTQLLIVPGYRFRIARAMVTNFHQPQSTLLLLVAAMVGSEWKKLYEYALDHDFRFLSYGDGCLLFAADP